MKGCDFVKKAVSDKAKSHPLTYGVLFRLAAILMILTIITTRMVFGLYARYSVVGGGKESARTAAMAGIELEELSVVIHPDIDDMIADDCIYTFGSTFQNGIEYEYVVPGMDIPKNPYIITDGKNEVPCYLYTEVIKEDVPDTVTFELQSEWQKIEGISGKNGGDVYFYSDVVEAGEKNDRIEIIKDNKIYVSQHFSADNTFTISFVGYMIQAADGCTAEELFENHVKDGE